MDNRKLGVSVGVGVLVMILMVSTLTSSVLANNSGKGLKVYVRIHNVQNEVDVTVNADDYTMHDRLFATGTATAYFQFPSGVVGVGDEIGACAHESGQPSNRDCSSTYNSEAKRPEYIDLFLSDDSNDNTQSQFQQDQSQSQSQSQAQENNNVINIYPPDRYYN